MTCSESCEGFRPRSGLVIRQQGVQWPKRQRAGGALLPPSPRPAHDVYNLVLVLKPAGNSGTARAIDIWYRESGQQYHMRTGFALKVFVGRC